MRFLGRQNKAATPRLTGVLGHAPSSQEAYLPQASQPAGNHSGATDTATNHPVVADAAIDHSLHVDATANTIPTSVAISKSPIIAVTRCQTALDQCNKHHMRTRSKFGILKLKAFLATREPSSLKEALNQIVWNKAMSDEVLALVRKKKTYTLVKLPIGRKVIGCKAYQDADWAFHLDDRRSTTGLAIFFGSNLMAWKKLTWLHYLFSELRLQLSQSLIIWCDNLSIIMLTQNPILHARTKHIELDLYFVRGKVLNKMVQIKHVSTYDHLAYGLTKAIWSEVC
uniref:Uncharacterized protein n=1 Tax=Cannabis sativa TaxID=3483 RepID=A0A803NSE0_CANSA